MESLPYKSAVSFHRRRAKRASGIDQVAIVSR
jgi:hypothetical protein